jgi:hypothetical protein
MPKRTDVDNGAKYVIYRGHIVLAEFPRWGVGLTAALRTYEISHAKLWEAIESGKVAAGLRQGSRRRFFAISKVDLEKFIARRNAPKARTDDVPPPDGVPLTELAADLDVPSSTLSLWCRIRKHPALGRAVRRSLQPREVRSGNGRRVTVTSLIVSRADITACARTVQNPCGPIPSNPGRWLSVAEGIFQHTGGRLFFTAEYIFAHEAEYEIKGQGSNLYWPKESRLSGSDVLTVGHPGITPPQVNGIRRSRRLSPES